ncbi:hypothetical protein JHK82_012489 [Glycine max]|uniref:Uncharacterized protein n=1 Tax=Glycine max TaxID=3847 RepID=K7KPC6_SOYBN|nr:hypothetical protein JHK85_012844 [Glycine max]KAG5057514.1 hypothetical protein JHK86_012510 [Glycine max]KAG5154520.1 hypothetical protein JHK82_012489 [Glycine max]KAH1133673.1 hypothetical protein GYH30_012195 [Glycine max]KRH58023.1 hypothetical protein GLYMA_05G101200v4 [Glycine max]
MLQIIIGNDRNLGLECVAVCGSIQSKPFQVFWLRISARSPSWTLSVFRVISSMNCNAFAFSSSQLAMAMVGFHKFQSQHKKER